MEKNNSKKVKFISITQEKFDQLIESGEITDETITFTSLEEEDTINAKETQATNPNESKIEGNNTEDEERTDN